MNLRPLSQNWTNSSMDKCPKHNYHFLMHILTLALTVAMSWTATAQSLKYNELMIKDYDEMNKEVQAHLKRARAVGSNSSDENVNDEEAVEHCREALKVILSRPNSDNMVAKLSPEIRRELVGYNAFERVVAGLAGEAVRAVKNEKAPAALQATSLFLLENLLSEIRPEIPNNDGLRRVVEKIAEADVEISKDVKKDMKLRGMFKALDPSKLAKDILKASPKVAKPPPAKKAKDSDEG